MIYCRLCRDFCPSTSFRVLKSKPGKNTCDKHPPPEVDPNGRYCRKCDKILCVTAFPSGQRRFVCKRHAWNDKGKVAKEKILKANPWKKEVARLYSLCYNDCKFFNQHKIELTQTEIAKLFVGQSTHDEPARDFTAITALGFAVLPLRPGEILSKRNVALVSRADRGRLLCCMKQQDWETYTAMVSRLDVAVGRLSGGGPVHHLPEKQPPCPDSEGGGVILPGNSCTTPP